MSKSLLFIAFPFPPSRGAGVYRTVAIANFLVSEGWEVTVIAPEEGYFLRYQGSEDRSLMSWPDPRIRVVRVPLTNWYQEAANGPVSSWDRAFPTTAGRTRKRWSRYVSPLESYAFWFRPALRAATRVMRNRKHDLILATGNPFNSFLVARILGRRTNTPYVLDYRDAWTFDQFTGKLKPGATDVALALERRVLTGSRAYISVNQAIVDWLADTHAVPDSVQRAVIENGYDPEFIEPPAEPEWASPRDQRITLTHVGTLVPGKLDLAGILTEFEQTARAVDLDIELRFHGYLGFSNAHDDLLRGLFETNHKIRHLGAVAKKDVAGIYAMADALFLPLYESPYVTSGKVYEMMATCKPILAWGPSTAGAMRPLSGYPLLIHADRARPETWPTALETVARWRKEPPGELIEAARSYARQFERTTLLRPLGDLLEKLVP
ncbi:MAG TPA: glycosyltransferase [Acidimicrobiia bacterium]|nr:glycosyltransferase [Acidimicrobiia bacterium]